MSLLYKASYICLLILTIFSIVLSGYTLYALVGTGLAVRSLEVILLDVEVDEDIPQVSFYLTLCNKIRMPLKLFLIEASVDYDSDHIGNRIISYHSDPLPLPFAEEKNVTVTLELDDINHLQGVWRMDVTFRLDTVLPRRGPGARASRVLEM